jgi:hypothetical protein
MRPPAQSQQEEECCGGKVAHLAVIFARQRGAEVCGLLDLLTSLISNPTLLLIDEKGSICELLF